MRRSPILGQALPLLGPTCRKNSVCEEERKKGYPAAPLGRQLVLPVDAATRTSGRFFLSSVGKAPTAPLQFSRVVRPPSDLTPCTEYFQFVVPFFRTIFFC
jgi:hypothetical protein